MATYTVLDVSKYNSVTSYTSAASAVDGVIIRAGYRGYGTSGTLVTDSSFSTHYNGFVGKTKIGVYWFTQAISTSEAIAEANYLYNIIRDCEIDFPIYINSDYSNSSHDGRADSLNKIDRTQYITDFCERMNELGYRTGVYASDAWFNNNLVIQDLKNREYSLHVVKHSVTPPVYVTEYDGWEYTENGFVIGIVGSVNESKFYNDVAGWVTEKPDIATFDITITSGTEYIYTGDEIKPDFTIRLLLEDKDYVVNYINNVNAGTGSVYIVGIGDYGGHTSFDFTILPINIEPMEMDFEPKIAPYTGNPIIGRVTIPGLTYLDFDVSYKNNINAGIATVTVKGIGNYTGTKTTTFVITSDILSPDYFSLERYEYRYTGYPIEPEVINSSTLKEGIDFNIDYSNNIERGTGSVIIRGIGNRSGTVIIDFMITNMSIADKEVILSNYTFPYDGYAKYPAVTIKDLTEGVDFRVLYEDNIDVGTAYVTVSGIGRYVGEQEVTFTITKQSIFEIEASLEYEEYYYNTKPIQPKVIVPSWLRLNRDYRVSYLNNSGIGTGTAVITGINNYTGTINIDFVILPTPIEKCIAKYGRASVKTIYRIETDGVLHIYFDKNEEIELRESFDYMISSHKIQQLESFALHTFEVKGVGGFYGDITYRFRTLPVEPDVPIDYEDDLVYNFGDIDIGDESAYGTYEFEDIDDPSTKPPKKLLNNKDQDYGDLDEEDAPIRVFDGEDYDFDKFSGMRMDSFDEDDGTNIDENGESKEEKEEEHPGGGLPDNGKYNFGDIDEGDETAVGDYDFGDLDEGVSEESVANGDYDFNILCGDDEEGKSLVPGTEYILKDTPIYSTYTYGSSFDIRSGQYFIYSGAIKNNRVRVCKLDAFVEAPAKSSGWCDITDLENLGKLVVGDEVLVDGYLYEFANGTGSTIYRELVVMYITQILDETQYEYPYGLSTTSTSTRIGYAGKNIIRKYEEDMPMPIKKEEESEDTVEIKFKEDSSISLNNESIKVEIKKDPEPEPEPEPENPDVNEPEEGDEPKEDETDDKDIEGGDLDNTTSEDIENFKNILNKIMQNIQE